MIQLSVETNLQKNKKKQKCLVQHHNYQIKDLGLCTLFIDTISL